MIQDKNKISLDYYVIIYNGGDMKRRDLIKTALSSVVTTAILSIPGRSSAENNTTQGTATLPKNDVPIESPNAVFTMPDKFWETFHGTLYLGKAGEDPSLAENQQDIFLRTGSGTISTLPQPIRLDKTIFEKFLSDGDTLMSANDYSMAMYDSFGNRIFYIPNVRNSEVTDFSRRLVDPTGYQLIGQISSYDNLRNTRPLFSGARVRLSGWHDKHDLGGGTFVGKLTSVADDGGFIASCGKNYHWQRIINDINHMTLFDFGAIPDGKTDCLPAINAMYAWAQKNNQQISIQFPAGRFFISCFDISDSSSRFFRVAGAPVNFGYFPATTIVSDGVSDFVFKLNSRWVEVSNISFYGSTDKNTNTQGFLHNICTGGQFFRGSSLRFTYVGGTALSLMDTLDCKIDQWYATRCSGDVIKGVWSNVPKGSWNHNTAIELSNFNAQYCTQGQVLNLPRCSQSIIHNGWIEHTEFPGDISDGQWIIDALSMEGCTHPLNAKSSRLNMRQINLQVGSQIDNSPQKGGWINEYERGSTHIESFGVAIDGCLKYHYLTSQYRLSNNTSDEVWVELGRLYSPEAGDFWQLEIIGQPALNESQGSARFLSVTEGNLLGGRAVINVQRKTKRSEVSWFMEGNSPVVDVIFSSPYDTDTRIFVKLARELVSAGVMLKTTAKDRFLAGQCALFSAVMTTLSEAPAVGKLAPRRLSLHNGLAGFGANDDGDILFSSRLLSESGVDTQTTKGFLSVVINGERCAIPYFKLK